MTTPMSTERKVGCALFVVKTKIKAMIKVDVLASIRILNLLQKTTPTPTKFLVLIVE